MKVVLISEDDFRAILLEHRELILSEITTLFKSEVDTDKKLSAKEAASFLGISLSTLYKNVKSIPHKKFGKKHVFSSVELSKIQSMPFTRQLEMSA